MSDTFGGQLAEVMAADDETFPPVVYEDEKGAAEAEAEDEPELPGMGHNAPPEPIEEPVVEPLLPAMDIASSSTAQGRLKTILARIESLNEDKAAIMGDIKEVYLEAKGEGFDTKILRKVVALRAQDAAKRQEEEALIDLYMVGSGSV